MRSGTENVSGIAGFGAACRIYHGKRMIARIMSLQISIDVVTICPGVILHFILFDSVPQM